MSAADHGGKGASRGTHAGQAPAELAIGAGEIAPVAAVPATSDQADDLLPLGVSPLAPRGRGRPQGSKNRRTDLVAEYLVDRFGDPLTASMSIGGRPLRELVTELRTVASDVGMKLGATVMEIARWQQQCRADALPYIHAKRAQETAKGDPVLPIIGIGRADQVIIAGGRSLEDAVANQALTIEGREVSHSEMSHGEGKPDEPTA